jgi:hypothetical protein
LKRLKFRLKKGSGSVSSFSDAQGKKYLPGDIVDLPASYKGEKWLEPVEEDPKPVAAESKVEPAPEPATPVPLESPKKSKKQR